MARSFPTRVLGCMSGTSMDGVDAAVLVTDGQRIIDFGPAAFRPYSDEERAVIAAAQGTWPGDPLAEAATRVVDDAHADIIAGFDDVDLVGFHGQTLAHDPGGRGTHQAGDGDRLAAAVGLPVVWDFRSADVALGGQGAPLAPFYHFACAQWIGASAPIAFLNLGGVGNITAVDPNTDGPEAPGALLAFDTGPANALLDDLVAVRTGERMDRDGALARAGRIDDAVIERFLANPYFARIPPKSLDRNAFAGLWEAVQSLSTEDAAATLLTASALSVALGLEHLDTVPERVLVGGGGRQNPTLIEAIAAAIPCPLAPVEEAGLDGDMLEAQAFAHLAARVVRGLPTSCPGTTGVAAAVAGGQVSRA